MDTKEICIVGGDGLARECYTYIERMRLSWGGISFKGFWGEGGHEPKLKEFMPLFKGDVSGYSFKANDYVVLGSGIPEIRSRTYECLLKRGVRFFTVLDPSSVVFDYSDIGEANIFATNCRISSQSKIGNGNVFNGDNTIGHDASVGNFNFIAPQVQLLGHVKVGSFNSIGTGSVILPKVSVGNGNKIAPLSAVYSRCRDNKTLLGNPAVEVL